MERVMTQDEADKFSNNSLRDDALDKANIENLTALWRAAGAQRLFGAETVDVYACHRWPNRHWFGSNGVLPESEALQNILKRFGPAAMVPVWGENRHLESALRESGFEPCLEQLAMHLELATRAPVGLDNCLALRPVQSAIDIDIWVRVCGEAFGYALDVPVISGLMARADASLWLAERDGKPVGTALLFRTGEVMGIHQVGVPDTFRGQGIARALMQALLNHCQQSGARYVTLQASKMGEGLYRQLGFEPRFPISSYRRP
ncbi:GNAT family N-acetyltransferase [Microbulbifer sp. SA54]|uniref:GNAT family N-acetyltransferase n=1 Tax=Microbulbifer sp. SA54 TaxID=3401577 RepID=UPI003AAEDD26